MTVSIFSPPKIKASGKLITGGLYDVMRTKCFNFSLKCKRDYLG
jgi:hypothetical protein